MATHVLIQIIPRLVALRSFASALSPPQPNQGQKCQSSAVARPPNTNAPLTSSDSSTNSKHELEKKGNKQLKNEALSKSRKERRDKDGEGRPRSKPSEQLERDASSSPESEEAVTQEDPPPSSIRAEDFESASSIYETAVSAHLFLVLPVHALCPLSSLPSGVLPPPLPSLVIRRCQVTPPLHSLLAIPPERIRRLPAPVRAPHSTRRLGDHRRRRISCCLRRGDGCVLESSSPGPEEEIEGQVLQEICAADSEDSALDIACDTSEVRDGRGYKFYFSMCHPLSIYE